MESVITTLGDMIEHCRYMLGDINETSDDSVLLWNDAELTNFANRAVSEVALRTKCIRDKSDTTDLTSFEITSGGDPWAVIVPEILQIKRVLWDGLDLKPADKRQLDDTGSSDWETLTGTPSHYILDYQAREIRPYKLPDADGTLKIEVIRRPVTQMSEIANEPEIPLQYRHGALNWMCHLAFLKNDSDTIDDKQSSKYEALFTYEFGPRQDARTVEWMFHASRPARGRLHF